MLDAEQVLASHLCNFRHVVAEVAALWWFLAVQPCIHRGAKTSRLRVVRVDVVLALDLVARELEHTADRVAEDRAATVPDVQRPCRVDARELDLQLLALAQVKGSVAWANGRHVTDKLLEPLGREAEVHVAAGDLDLRRGVGDLDRRGEPARDLLWRLFESPGELHSGGARVVAAFGRLGPAQLEVRQFAVDSDGARGVSHGLVELLADARGHEQVGCSPVSVS